MKVQFSFYFRDEEEHQTFKELAKSFRTSLAQLVIDSLYAAKESPEFLNPTKDVKSLDELMDLLNKQIDIAGKGEKEFRFDLKTELNIINQKIDLLMTKMKISKKELEKFVTQDKSGEMVFK